MGNSTVVPESNSHPQPSTDRRMQESATSFDIIPILQENSRLKQELLAMQEANSFVTQLVTQLNDKVALLEATLAAAKDEIEERDDALLELNEAYVCFKGLAIQDRDRPDATPSSYEAGLRIREENPSQFCNKIQPETATPVISLILTSGRQFK